MITLNNSGPKGMNYLSLVAKMERSAIAGG